MYYICMNAIVSMCGGGWRDDQVISSRTPFVLILDLICQQYANYIHHTTERGKEEMPLSYGYFQL